MSDDLKPCPFCGGTPVLDHLGQSRKRGFYIRCDNCEVQQIAIYTIDAAKAAWNRRETVNA